MVSDIACPLGRAEDDGEWASYRQVGQEFTARLFKSPFELKVKQLTDSLQESTTELWRRIVYPVRMKLKIAKCGPAVQEEIHIGVFKQEYEVTKYKWYKFLQTL